MTNEELYRQYLSGDTEAFERLYLQMQGFIASVAKDAAQSFGCSCDVTRSVSKMTEIEGRGGKRWDKPKKAGKSRDCRGEKF